MPFNILWIWFRGLLSIAILGGGLYLLSRWYDDSRVVERVSVPATAAGPDDVRRDPEGKPIATETPAPAVRVFRFEPGWNRPTYELAGALALLAWASLGRWIGSGVRSLTLRTGEAPSAAPEAAPARRAGDDRADAPPEPDVDPYGDRHGEVHKVRRPDGSELRIECYGPPDAPPIVWSHGWGADSTEWFYQKRFLADRFRLIVWDIPGMGLSKKPDDDDFSLENLAGALKDVIAFAGERPVLLAGHSIGGMITLTLAREHPELLGTRVAGLALVHTTYTNPVRTTRMAAFYTSIEKPVIVPLLYLTIGLWPLAWAMMWLSYLNGSAHRSTHKSSFSGNETRGQLDFISRFVPMCRPDVLARGMLGMLAYDATEALPRIPVPTLVVVGDKDTTTPPECGDFIAEHVPSAELVKLAPAKHMGLFEHHGPFNRAIARFASRCQAGERVV
ncbi:Arylesterase [Planctomyces sp. SH-PL62]|nr:Arylesterase [Planctomyces sp. SH-PL62]